MIHEEYMERAIALAKKAAQLREAPVGCVIVRDGQIIGEGYNTREADKNALAHAEIIAINQACAAVGGWRLFDCDLYVTLEPCPMCAGAMINSRIANVFFGASDKKAGSCGSVVDLFSLPYNHKPSAAGGILERRCAALLTDFFKSLRAEKSKTNNM